MSHPAIQVQRRRSARGGTTCCGRLRREPLSRDRLASLHPATGRDRLPGPDERRLVLEAQRGDGLARDALVELFLPSIAAVARRYRRSGSISEEELLQEGVAGLLCALGRYEDDRDTPFWAYAVWWVRQAMQQLTAQLTGPVVLSDRALRQLARVKRASRAYEQQHAAEPTIGQLAVGAGVSCDELERLLAAGSPARGLDERADQDGAESPGDMLADPAAEEAYDHALRHAEIDHVQRRLRELGDRQRTILAARYGLHGREQTLREIGLRLGMTAERVRQIEQGALAELDRDGG